MSALILGAVLAVSAVVLVALPFLRETEGDDQLETSSPAEDQRIALSEERDRVLAALKELEFDHTTGRVSDEDYRSLVGPLRRAAAEALQGIDAIDAQSQLPAAEE
jgi:hypothetical protein